MDLRHLAEQYRFTSYTPRGPRTYVRTDYGDLTVERWENLARLAIAEEDKGDLLERVEDYIGKHFRRIPPSKLMECALNAVLRGSYIDWKDFDDQETDQGDAAEPVRLDCKPDEE